MHITNYLYFIVSASTKEQSSVADAHKVDADPAFHFDTDPDPDPTFNMMQIQIQESATSVKRSS